jgi:hypothetical protein
MKSRAPTIATLLAGLACLLLPGCCTMAGCRDRLEIRIAQNESEPIARAVYQIKLSLPDGQAQWLECDTTEASPTCGDADAGPSFGNDQYVEIENGHLLVTLEGRGDEWASPAEITVRVESAGQLLGQQTFTPVYETIQPNGPRCDPTCYIGEVEMLIAYPPEEQ